jgi:hypothetical protein
MVCKCSVTEAEPRHPHKAVEPDPSVLDDCCPTERPSGPLHLFEVVVQAGTLEPCVRVKRLAVGRVVPEREQDYAPAGAELGQLLRRSSHLKAVVARAGRSKAAGSCGVVVRFNHRIESNKVKSPSAAYLGM